MWTIRKKKEIAQKKFRLFQRIIDSKYNNSALSVSFFSNFRFLQNMNIFYEY